MDNHFSGDSASVEDVNNQDIDMILPNCTDLDWAQIIFAINYKRILFIHRFQAWTGFHTDTSDNTFKYSDYTPEELCHRFLQRVLPNIFEYELTADELYLLNLMDVHPNFEKNSTGFKFIERPVSLSFPLDESAIKTLNTMEILQKEPSFVSSDVKLNGQIITVGTGMENSIWRKLNLNAENAALLSITLCSDEELPNCELLTIEEVLKRLKAAKAQFENNGHQLENVNISLDDLLKKIHTLSKLKEAVAKLVDNSFCKKKYCSLDSYN